MSPTLTVCHLHCPVSSICERFISHLSRPSFLSNTSWDNTADLADLNAEGMFTTL